MPYALLIVETPGEREVRSAAEGREIIFIASALIFENVFGKGKQYRALMARYE